MVVLEAGMLTSSANQYLQPDYLSPLSTTLDAKKSPLALLAQTCSQIGADGPPAKPLSMERPSKKTHRPSSASQESNQKRSSPSASTTNMGSPSTSPVNSTPPAPAKLAFKPYEANVLSRREDRPPSKSGSENEDRKSAPPQRKSSSPIATTTTPTQSPAAASADRKSSSPANASPIIRSGLEVLQGHPKDLPLGTYKPGALSTAGLTAAQLAQLCCPPGYDPTHPAFRPPFAGAAAAAAFSHQQAAALLAAGYGSPAAAAAAAAAAANPYISYARVKTPNGGEAYVPVCKDPYCAGCPFSMHSAMLAASGAAAAAAGAAGTPCPAGCTQCEHQKWMTPTSAYPAATAAASAAAAAHQLAGRPYQCNWVGGDSYCGKRFATSDELLVHLRNHTNPMTASAPGSSSSASAAAAAAAAAAATSSYSSARFHPYSKPGFPAGLPASPYSAFNPTALGPYYSPYALYGQRIGAAVHP